MLLLANHRYVGSIGSSHKESTSPMPIDHPKRKKKIGSPRFADYLAWLKRFVEEQGPHQEGYA